MVSTMLMMVSTIVSHQLPGISGTPMVLRLSHIQVKTLQQRSTKVANNRPSPRWSCVHGSSRPARLLRVLIEDERDGEDAVRMRPRQSQRPNRAAHLGQDEEPAQDQKFREVRNNYYSNRPEKK